MTLTVVPAYGRDYESKEEVLKAWDNYRDFLIQDTSCPDNGRYINKQDAPAGMIVKVRFDKRRKICLIEVV